MEESKSRVSGRIEGESCESEITNSVYPERINKISGPNDPRYSFPFLFRGKFVVIFRSMIAPLIKRFFDPGINFFSKIRERERESNRPESAISWPIPRGDVVDQGWPRGGSNLTC